MTARSEKGKEEKNQQGMASGWWWVGGWVVTREAESVRDE